TSGIEFDDYHSMTQKKIREYKLRRLLERRFGYSLRKSRRRDASDYGLYRIDDPVGNSVIAGVAPPDFSMTLDEVELWIEQRPGPDLETWLHLQYPGLEHHSDGRAILQQLRKERKAARTKPPRAKPLRPQE